MRKIIRYILIALSCILLHSCDYEPVRTSSPTGFKFEFEGLLGTQVSISVTPEDDNVAFFYDVIEVSEYEDFIASGKTGQDLAQMIVDKKREWYDGWLESVSGREEYHASWMDFWLMGPGHSRLFVNLKPQTDYYAYAFCIKPGAFEPMGNVRLCRFTTTEIQYLEPHMAFEFMLFDSADGFSYYVRPTERGRICKDLYLTTIVDNEVLQSPPYNGDIYLYTNHWYEERKDSIELYLKSDISRIDVDIEMEDGKSYTILAAQYNIGEDNPVFNYFFYYEKGLRTEGYMGRLY